MNVYNASTSFLNTTFTLKGLFTTKWCHSTPKLLYFFCGTKKEIFFLNVFLSMQWKSLKHHVHVLDPTDFNFSGKNEFLKTYFLFPGRKKVIQVWKDIRTDDTFYYLFSWYSVFLFKFTFILKTDMWESIHTFRGILLLLILIPRDVDLRCWKHPSLFFITTPTVSVSALEKL